MKAITTLPTKEGQICRIIEPKIDGSYDDVYIICEDPSHYDDDENIYIASLSDLQKNINNPQLTPQLSIIKKEVTVLADDLQGYINGVNHNDSL